VEDFELEGVMWSRKKEGGREGITMYGRFCRRRKLFISSDLVGHGHSAEFDKIFEYSTMGAFSARLGLHLMRFIYSCSEWMEDRYTANHC
jgi:hypothetical protein